MSLPGANVVKQASIIEKMATVGVLVPPYFASPTLHTDEHTQALLIPTPHTPKFTPWRAPPAMHR